ncbi:unnamed protein product, partial [Mesorhabditis belari]|uniref:Band 4.1 C-terminal domain-containing protein n=1 Tax=Mesorhabditis belari TaxID=2138241 RepID=A0AAF3J9P5_9BILA
MPEIEEQETAVVYLKEVQGEENEETHDEKENKKKRDWGFHLPSFKMGGSRRSTKEGEEPYPIVSEPYEGPLDSVDRENDLEKIPLDTTPVPESKTTTITTTRRFFLFGRVRHEGEEEVIEQEHVKPDTYGLATTSYEGPLEELPREDDLGASPLGEHAAVYHPGDSWLTANEQKKKKTKKDKAASPTMPEIEESKQTAVVYLKEVQGEENEETHDEKENKKKRDWGFHLPSFKIGGSRRSTKEGEALSNRFCLWAHSTLWIVASRASIWPPHRHTESLLCPVVRSGNDGAAVVYPGASPMVHENLPHHPLSDSVNLHANYATYPRKTQRLRIFSRFIHPGEVEMIEKEKIDKSLYPIQTATEGDVDVMQRNSEMVFSNLKSSCEAYHEGQYHKLPIVPPFTPTKSYQPQLSADAATSPIHNLEPLAELESRLFNLQDEINGPETEIVEVRIERRCEIELRPVYTLKSKKPRPAGGGVSRGVAERKDIHSTFTTTPPPTEEEDQPSTSATMPSGRNFLQRIGLFKNGTSKEKKKKSKKGKDGTDTSSSSSSSEDEKAVVVVRQSTTTTTANRSPGEMPPQTLHYTPADHSCGVVIRQETDQTTYRLVGSGLTPRVDPNNPSLPSTMARAERLNLRSPRLEHAERILTIRGASDLPVSLAESGQPHTTVQRWQETNILPDQVVTEVDEDGNTVTRTIKTSQVKSTVQKQTFQNFTVPEDENTISTVERVREQVVPRTSPDKSGKLVETHTRTVAYENGAQPAQEDLGEFVSSKTVTSGNRTVETITYKTEKDGVVETHVEHRVTIHSDDAIDHDAELSKAILEATQMNPDMTVEKIEVKQEATQ